MIRALDAIDVDTTISQMMSTKSMAAAATTMKSQPSPNEATEGIASAPQEESSEDSPVCTDSEETATENEVTTEAEHQAPLVRALLEEALISLRSTLPELIRQSPAIDPTSDHHKLMEKGSDGAASEKFDLDQKSQLDVTAATLAYRDPSSTVSSPDVDLLNRLSNLEKELEHSRKHFEEQKESLEQQLEMWREKNSMRQEKQRAMNEEINGLEEKVGHLNHAMQDKNQEIEALMKQLEQSGKDQESILGKLSEMEQSRANYMRENEERGKKIHNMQQMINNGNKKLKDVSSSREKLVREVSDMQKKLSQMEPFAEKGKRFDQVVKELGEEREKIESLRQELMNYQSEQEKLKDDIVNKDARIKSSQTSISQLQAQIESLNEQLDTLAKERDATVERARQYVAEMDERDKSLTSEIKSLHEQNKHQTTRIGQLEQDAIHFFVQLALVHCSLSIVEAKYAAENSKLEQLRVDHSSAITCQQELEKRNSILEQRVKDQEVDVSLRLKQSKALIRELRSQVQRERKKRERLLSSSTNATTSVTHPTSTALTQSAASPIRPSGNNIENPSIMRTSSSASNLQGLRRHSSQYSGISEGSAMSSFSAMNNMSVINGGGGGGVALRPRNSISLSRKSSDSNLSALDVDSPVAYPNVTDEQLIKENNILLRRVADLQTWRWHLEEQSRVIKDEMARLKLDLDKKGEIIEYYLQREKLGRLAPEQERNRNLMAQKSERSFMASIFSSGIGNISPIGGGSNSTSRHVSTEAYSKMQQVMEETLLLNIELQQNMKIMGEDVARLQEENQQLKSKLCKVQQ